jgi:ferredoxin-fold anticodon binding domain-containing protein
MLIAKKKQNAERLTSGRVHVGTIKKSGRNGRQHIGKNKLGRPLTKE